MPINNIAQTISTIPPAGARGVDVQSIFVTKQEDFQDHLQGITVVELNALVTQQNTMAGAMNSTATQVNTNANIATTQAGIATTKASEASTSASQALTSRNQAETFKNSASTSASTATTKASEASASAVSASTSASTATTKASEASASAVSASTSASTATTKASAASTSASTATTKASEASASAVSASTSASTATTKASEASASASQALTSRNQAETFAQQASASATSVDATNIVYRTGNQTIAGVKTFSSDIVGSLTGNAATATKLATTRNIALSGDVTGNVNFDGTGNVNIATTIAPNSILLGTDTTGNYVAGNTAGTGITVSGTAGEGWSPTISLTNVGAAGTYRSVTTDAQGRVTAGTNPTTVSGYGLTDVYTKTENTASLALKVNNSEKGVANGIATLGANGKVVLTQIPDSLLGQLEYIGIWNFATLPTATEKGQYWIASVSGNGYEVGDWAVWNGSTFDKVDNTDAVATVAGRTGNVVLTKSDVGLGLVDNTADASKNVLSATKWAVARTVTLSGDITGSASIDGSANVTITTTVQPNSVALGTDTTGNYVAGNTAGTGITISGTAGEGWSPTIALSNVGTAGTYRSVTTDAQGRVTAGTNPTTLEGYAITDAQTASRTTATFTTVANTWYRIATSAVGIGRNSAEFVVDWTVSSHHGSTRFAAGCHYGEAAGVSLMQTNYSKFGTSGITEARIVYHTTLTGNYAYVEVKFAGALTNVAVNVEMQDTIGWSLLSPSTAGSVPAGYTSYLHTFVPTAAITAGTYPKVTINQEGRVTSGTTLVDADIPVLDASKITTGTLPVVRGGTGVTTSTGTGNNVLSTSPTLATPNIGVATGTSFNSITGLATVAPLVAGTATVGTSTLTARQDHIHPVQTSVTGNAGTATTLQTARTINGVAFDGSANITVSDSTAVKLTDNQTVAGIKTFSSSPVVPTPTAITQATNKQYVDSKYSGFKNYIINGKKAINQRALTATDNSYNHDRWYKAGVNWYQGIERVDNLISGKVYTLSWIGSATAGYFVGNTTSSTINAQTFTPIVNGGSFTLTISADQNLWIKFVSDATGSTFNFVQLEEGSVATPFENRPYGLELSLCHRYFERVYIPQDSPFTFGQAYNPVLVGFTIVTKVPMRVAPTHSVINLQATQAGGSPVAVSSISSGKSTIGFLSISGTTTGLASGNASAISGGVGGGEYSLSAEL